MRDLINKRLLVALVLSMTVMLIPVEALAAGFANLTGSGVKIFTGLKSIIYPASAIGIICVCIGGFFGNINWKWLTTVVVGLIVISLCGGLIQMFSGKNPGLGDSAHVLSGM